MRFFKDKKMQAVKSSKSSEKPNNINEKVTNSSNKLNVSLNKSPENKNFISELALLRILP